ncbi:MAG: M56 family metallopeptidase [Capsulimonas sp.]|uniref:M56 family metallopeptidase n=1 Tax=Capsulimonas sp. TaxID=2494211 RepID=UPI0032666538
MSIFLLLIADASLKASVLIGLAMVATRFARRTSAATRHLFWTLALIGSLLLPLLSFTLPHWNTVVPSISSPRLQESPSVPNTLHSVAPAPVNAAPSTQAPTAFGNGIPDSVSVPSASPPMERSEAGLDWSAIILVVWTIGCLAILAMLLRSLDAVAKIECVSGAISGNALEQAASEAFRVISPRQTVQFRIAAPSSDVAVPITWGGLRPTVLLPANAVHWPPSRASAALLHELAHVRRQDWLLLIAARIVCAIFWFHPLVWFAAAKMREESETACDDLVVLGGMPATEYARQLLDVALAARKNQSARLGAVAMAQKPNVETRLRSILASGRTRRPLQRYWVASIVTSILAFTTLMAALHVSAFTNADLKREQLQVVQSLPGGGKIYMLAVSYAPSKYGYTSWISAKKPFDRRTNLPDFKWEPTSTGAEQVRQFMFLPVGLGDDTSITIDVPEASAQHYWLGGYDGGPTYPGVSAIFRPGVQTATLRVGVARRALKTVASVSSSLLGTSTTAFGRQRITISRLTPSAGGDRDSYVIRDNILDQDTRILILDGAGKEMPLGITEEHKSPSERERRYTFFPSYQPKVKRILFQVRSYEWAEFRDVPLQAPSDAQRQAYTHAPPATISKAAATHIALGLRRIRSTDKYPALAEFRKAIELDPFNQEAQSYLTWALNDIQISVFTHNRNIDFFPPPSPAVADAIKDLQNAP